MHGNQINEQTNFMETIDQIKKAEEETEKIKNAAREKADQILRKGKESAMKAESETEKEITELKNSIFRKGSDDVEKEIGKILDKAKHEAEEIKTQSIDKKQLSSILKSSLFAE